MSVTLHVYFLQSTYYSSASCTLQIGLDAPSHAVEHFTYSASRTRSDANLRGLKVRINSGDGKV